MDKNQKIAVAVIVAIALIAAWQLGKKPAVEQGQNENQENTQLEKNSGQSAEPAKEALKMPQEQETAVDGVWEGSLLKSDNQAKGNLMLKTDGHVIYLRTGRDYSALVGKQVKVTYSGTLESFALGDIVAK